MGLVQPQSQLYFLKLVLIVDRITGLPPPKHSYMGIYILTTRVELQQLSQVCVIFQTMFMFDY
jgi:hypothetical protein